MHAYDKQSPSDAWANKLTGMYVCVCKSQLCNTQGHDTQPPHTLICFVWCGIHVCVHVHDKQSPSGAWTKKLRGVYVYVNLYKSTL